MVEQENQPAVEAQTAASTEAASTATEEPSYSGDKGLIESTLERNPAIESKPVPLFAYGNRVRVAALHKNFEPYLDHLISVAGWARSTRLGGESLFFIELNDGSCQRSLQVVVTSAIEGFAEFSAAKVGSSFTATGKLIRSPKDGQPFELQVCAADVHKCKLVGIAPAGKLDQGGYPFPPKKHSIEFLRQQAHMRARTKLISSAMRVRNNLAYATHKFFQERGFQYIHTPIITASDCEGAGEMFQVTTGMPAADKPVSSMKLIERVGQELEEEKKAEEKPISKNLAKKLAKKNKGKGGAAPAEGEKPAADGEKPAEAAPVEEEKKEEAPLIPFEERKFNYRSDFFRKPAFLTVSGQINVETYCCGMGDVYTFGPTFRAEHSDTTRHLAEFWMIEPELAFAELPDVMDCAEDYVKYCLRYVFENNADDIEYFNTLDSELKNRLQNIMDTPFTRLTYTDAIKLIDEHLKDKKIKFKVKPKWGDDLGSEHERYLAEKVYHGPVSVYDYPRSFKAFYMRANEDNKTVQAFDMLVPGIGELIGGSAREERLDKLDEMLAEKNLNQEDYWWYRELRKFGTQPHGGFGLGFERLVMMTTGLENIRDVIPFPREYQKAEF